METIIDKLKKDVIIINDIFKKDDIKDILYFGLTQYDIFDITKQMDYLNEIINDYFILDKDFLYEKEFKTKDNNEILKKILYDTENDSNIKIKRINSNSKYYKEMSFDNENVFQIKIVYKPKNEYILKYYDRKICKNWFGFEYTKFVKLNKNVNFDIELSFLVKYDENLKDFIYIDVLILYDKLIREVINNIPTFDSELIRILNLSSKYN